MSRRDVAVTAVYMRYGAKTHAQVTKGLLKCIDKGWRHFIDNRRAHHVGIFTPQGTPLREQLGQIQEVRYPVHEDLQRCAHGIPVNGRCKDDLLKFEDAFQHAFKVVASVAVLVVISGDDLFAQIDHFDLKRLRNLVHQLPRIAVATRAGEQRDGTQHLEIRPVGWLLIMRSPASRKLCFPVAAIDSSNRHARNRIGVYAVDVDAETIGMRTRHIKRFDATDRTEQMLRRCGVECVGSERVLARQEFEVLSRDDQVSETGLAADGAVALEYLQGRWSHDLEANPAAVAATRVRDHGNPPAFIARH